MADLMQFLKDVLLWVPRKLWAEILDGLASLLESIPTPDFVLQAKDAFAGIGGNVLFFAQKLAVGEGITMILAALLLRFLLRRIPLIG